MDAATVEREALALTVAERALLADRLLQTLDWEDSDRMDALGREADRRLETFERGETEAFDGPAAVSEIRRELA